MTASTAAIADITGFADASAGGVAVAWLTIPFRSLWFSTVSIRAEFADTEDAEVGTGAEVNGGRQTERQGGPFNFLSLAAKPARVMVASRGDPLRPTMTSFTFL
jgi:hypothetical protein